MLMKNEVLENGDIVGQYTGEVTGGKEENQVGFYSLQMPLFKRLDNEIVQGFDNKRKLPKPVSIFYVDASKKGNLTRFMNHSCEPNCVYDTWINNGDAQVWVRVKSKKTIKGPEPLTIDYGVDAPKFFKDGICLCGSKQCRYPPPEAA